MQCYYIFSNSRLAHLAKKHKTGLLAQVLLKGYIIYDIGALVTP